MKKYLLLALLFFVFAPHAHAAIAFDAATSTSFGVVTSGTKAFLVGSGSNRIAICAVETNAASNVVSSITYAGSAMTIIGTGQNDASNGGFLTIYYLVAPTSGNNNVVVNLSSSQGLDLDCASYTGASQTGQPDSNNKGTAASGTTFPLSTTVVAANSWGVLFTLSTHGTLQNGTNATLRTNSSSNVGLYDTNSAQAAGSITMTASITGASSFWSGLIVTFSPAAAATTATPSIITSSSFF